MKKQEEKIKISSLNTIDDFIRFYRSIPTKKWCAFDFKDYDGKSCALGHLRCSSFTPFKKNSKSAIAKLAVLTESELKDEYVFPYDVIDVNDGPIGNYTQKTPKLRVLAFLKDKKSNQKIK